MRSNVSARGTVIGEICRRQSEPAKPGRGKRGGSEDWLGGTADGAVDGVSDGGTYVYCLVCPISPVHGLPRVGIDVYLSDRELPRELWPGVCLDR